MSRVASPRAQLEREALVAILTDSPTPLPTPSLQQQMPGTKSTDVYRYLRKLDRTGVIIWMGWNPNNAVAWWTTVRIVECAFCNVPCELSRPERVLYEDYGYEGHSWEAIYISAKSTHDHVERIVGFWCCDSPECIAKIDHGRHVQRVRLLTGKDPS